MTTRLNPRDATLERLATRACGLDGDAEVREHRGLADVLVQAARAERLVEAEVVVDGPGGDEARVGHGSGTAREYPKRAAQQVLEAFGGAVAQRTVGGFVGLGAAVAEVGER